MDWRPFKLLNDTEREWLERGVRNVVREWFARWLPDREAGSVRCVDASEHANTRLASQPERWIGVARRDAALSIALGHDVAQWLGEHLLGTATQSALVADVIAASLHDLGERLMAHDPGAPPVPSTQPPEPAILRRGTGAAIVEIALDATHALAFAATPAWVTQRLASRPRAVPSRRAAVDLRRCIGSGIVNLQAWAGGASIELGVLQSLAPGDVIRLDTRIDQPLRLSVQGHDSGRDAYLGSADGRRAMQLASR